MHLLFILFIYLSLGMRKVVVIAGFFTQNTNPKDQYVDLNEKSCVLLSPFNWVMGKHVYYVSRF